MSKRVQVQIEKLLIHYEVERIWKWLWCIGGKGKGQPRTRREGPEGEWRYRSTLSLTSVLVWGGWSTPRAGRFTPRKDSVPIL